MTIYYLLFFSFAYFYVVFGKIAVFNSGNLIRACLYGFLVFSVIAFRHPSMGVDLGYEESIGYLHSFQYLSSLTLSDLILLPSYLNYESGYLAFNWALGRIGDNYQILLVASALFSIVPVAILFYRESVSLELSYIIYLSLQSFLICFSGLRQGISVGICMIAFIFIKKRKWWTFVLLVLLAASFHYSSFLFLIAYPLYYLKISKRNRWYSVLVLFIVYLFKTPLFMLLSKLLKTNAVIEDTGAVTFFIVFSLVYIFCFLFANENEKNNGLLNLIFGACFCLAFTGVFSIAMRVGYSFMNMLPLILPIALHDMNNRNLKLASQIVVVTAFILFALNGLYSTSWTMSYPYKFFWE